MRINRIKPIEEYVKSVVTGNSVHNYEHVNRVRNWAVAIALEEGYERVDIVEAAALLHDIGYTYVDEADHGQVGAEKAREYLLVNGNFNEEEINEIVYAIRHHSSNRSGKGMLLYILWDADMMDGLGAFGILRCIKPLTEDRDYDPKNIKGETWGMGVKDFNERIDSGRGIGDNIVDHLNFQISWYDNLSTHTAKKLAKPLVEYMKEYIIKLEFESNAARNNEQ